MTDVAFNSANVCDRRHDVDASWGGTSALHRYTDPATAWRFMVGADRKHKHPSVGPGALYPITWNPLEAYHEPKVAVDPSWPRPKTKYVRVSAGDLAFVGKGGASAFSGTYMRDGPRSP